MKASAKNAAKPTKTVPPAPQISERARITSLVIGDIMVFVIFVVFGWNQHKGAANTAAIAQLVLVTVIFIVAWFLVAPVMGAYRRELMTEPRKMILLTLRAWVPAWLIAMILWGVLVYHGVPPVSFALVSLIFNAVILLLWRWPYALNNSIRYKS